MFRDIVEIFLAQAWKGLQYKEGNVHGHRLSCSTPHISSLPCMRMTAMFTFSSLIIFLLFLSCYFSSFCFLASLPPFFFLPFPFYYSLSLNTSLVPKLEVTVMWHIASQCITWRIETSLTTLNFSPESRETFTFTPANEHLI